MCCYCEKTNDETEVISAEIADKRNMEILDRWEYEEDQFYIRWWDHIKSILK